MHQRRSLRLLGNSLSLELPLSVFEACHQLTVGNSLELQGSAKRSSLAVEEIKLCVKKSLDSVCFELKGVQVGQPFEEVLHSSWKCIISEPQGSKASVGKNTKNSHKKHRQVCTNSGERVHEESEKGHSVNEEKPAEKSQSSSPSCSQNSASSSSDSNQAHCATETLKQEFILSPATIKEDVVSDSSLMVSSSDVLQKPPGGSTICKEEDSKAVLCSACGKDFSSAKAPLRSLVIHQKRYCLTYWNTPAVLRRNAARSEGSDHATVKMPSTRSSSAANGRKQVASSKNQCSYCSQSFTSRITKSRHEMFVCSRNPDVIKPHTCKLCRRPFPTQDLLTEHVSEKHEDKKVMERERKCELCGQMFKRANSLYVHKRTAHKIKEPKYCCPHCGKAFHFKDPYNMHVATHSDERPQLCPNCGKRFKNRDQLLKHRNRIHLDKWPYRCEKCGHGMDAKKYLLTHQCHRSRRNPDGSHRPNKYPKKLPKKQAPSHGLFPENSEKPIKVEMPKVTCSICGQSRKNNETLLKHVQQKHAGTENYEELVNRLSGLIRVRCNVCDKEFRSAKTLREHLQNVHTTEQCACQQCGKVFRTASHVKAHVKNVHQSSPARHACDQCPSMFKSRKNLLWHIRYQHTKLERKYKCPQCDFKYAFNKQYYEHRTRVHGPKKQQCPWCGYRCATRWYMNKHMKNCVHGRARYHKQDVATDELTMSCDQGAEIHGEKPISIKSELPDVLVQLEGDQVIVEEKPIDQKQMLEQLAHGAVLSQSLNDDEKCTAVTMKPLDQHTIIELPASWNEKTVPENVSLEEITCVDQPAEQLISNDIQQYCIIQEDGNKQIIQLVYADVSPD